MLEGARSHLGGGAFVVLVRLLLLFQLIVGCLHLCGCYTAEVRHERYLALAWVAHLRRPGSDRDVPCSFLRMMEAVLFVSLTISSIAAVRAAAAQHLASGGAHEKLGSGVSQSSAYPARAAPATSALRAAASASEYSLFTRSLFAAILLMSRLISLTWGQL